MTEEAGKRQRMSEKDGLDLRALEEVAERRRRREYMGCQRRIDETVRASSNMSTTGAIAPVVKQNAPVVKEICPLSQNLNYVKQFSILHES